MTIKSFNTDVNDELPVATDEECAARRNALIYVGIIKPDKDFPIKKGKPAVISTKASSDRRRQELIERGIIDPNPVSMFYESVHTSHKEEGQYKVRPIKSEKEYEVRKRAYFRLIQEILISRRELNILFNQWDDEKMGSWPSWYF